MTDTDDVLAANLEFYRAFNASDFPAMDALWAQSTAVLCVHPGWTALTGRQDVMQSWRDIFANPQPTHVMCHDDRAEIYGEMAVVLCEEELAGGHLVATNIFTREDGRWRMIHHHSGPIMGRPAARRQALH